MTISRPIAIIKASGDSEDFSEAKLAKSLSSTGVPPQIASDALKYLESRLQGGLTTRDLQEQVSSYLRDHAPVNNYYNYNLKRAVMDLGPSGHPFETLVSEVLRHRGYQTEIGVIVLGNCITHEVDVVAKKQAKQFFVECKFHNSAGTKTDVQVALYTYARYLDIKSAMEHGHGTQTAYYPWLITNTKVTSEVLDYAKCVGLEVTSWTYPLQRGLSDLIMAAGLHPVTLAYHLPRFKITQLLERGIVTCAKLKTALDDHVVNDILTASEAQKIRQDIKTLCQP